MLLEQLTKWIPSKHYLGYAPLLVAIIFLKPDLFINCSKNWEKQDLIDDYIDVIEPFTCSMFGYSKVICVSEARYLHFQSNCKLKEAAKLLDFLKTGLPSSWKLLETPENFRSSWKLLEPLDFERELLILLEISCNFLISIFQGLVLESFTADTM